MLRRAADLRSGGHPVHDRRLTLALTKTARGAPHQRVTTQQLRAAAFPLFTTAGTALCQRAGPVQGGASGLVLRVGVGAGGEQGGDGLGVAFSRPPPREVTGGLVQGGVSGLVLRIGVGFVGEQGGATSAWLYLAALCSGESPLLALSRGRFLNSPLMRKKPINPITPTRMTRSSIAALLRLVC